MSIKQLGHYTRSGFNGILTIILFLSISHTACRTASTKSITYGPKKSLPDQYSIMMLIDAGSSGSRLYAYRVETAKNAAFPKITLLNKKGDKMSRVEPGISDYEKDEVQAERNIETLMAYAESKYREQKANYPDIKKPSLYLMATAGMRMLSKKKQQRILAKVTDILDNSETLDFKKALVIPGQYEGLYSWLAVNYIDDRFDPRKHREGILEMGGASTQIAFHSSREIADFCLKRGIKGRDYLIYSRSFLFLGNDQMRRLVGVPTSCLPEGFLLNNGETGTGDFNECVSEIRERLLALCQNFSGGNRSNCLFDDGITDAALREYRGRFFAISAYYYDLKGLKVSLGDRFQPIDIRRIWPVYSRYGWMPDFVELVLEFLQSLNYDNFKRNYEYLQNRLINTAYYWSILTQVYLFSADTPRVSVQNQLKDFKSGLSTEMTWTLGAVLDIVLGHEPKGE